MSNTAKSLAGLILLFPGLGWSKTKTVLPPLDNFFEQVNRSEIVDFAVEGDNLAVITRTHLWHANLTTNALKRAALVDPPKAVATTQGQVLVLSGSAILRFRFSPYSVTEIRLKLDNPKDIIALDKEQFIISEQGGVVLVRGTKQTHHKFDQPSLYLDRKTIYITSGSGVFRLDPPWNRPVRAQNLECPINDLAFSLQTIFLICPSLVSRFDRNGQLVQKIKVRDDVTVLEMAVTKNAHHFLFSDNRIEIYDTTRQSTRVWHPGNPASKIRKITPSKAGLLLLHSGKISVLPKNMHTNS